MNIVEKNKKQISQWNERLNTKEKILHEIEVLKRVVNDRTRNTIYNSVVPCNGYIISKILQYQGIDFQYNRPEFIKCYYHVKKSTNDYITVSFKDANGEHKFYTIDIEQTK